MRGFSVVSREPREMKVRAAHLLLSPLLLVVACSNHPDSATFSGEVPSPSRPGSDGGSEAGGGATNGGSGTSGAGGISGAGSAVVGGSGGRATPGGVAAGAPGSSNEGGSGLVEAGGAAGGEPTPNDPEPPACGNGKLELGEQCDDAGHTGRDGCSSDCQVVCSDFGTNVESSADHHCYAGYDGADFETALAECEERGAHLVSIGSAAENEVVRGLVDSSKFIGAFEDVELSSNAAGTYEWITGEGFGYQNWGDEQPDRAAERCDRGFDHSRCYEHCAFMLGNGTWADQRCDLIDGYVCEWEPAGS